MYKTVTLQLQVAFRKYQGRYNVLVCQYNLPLGQLLSNILIGKLTIC
jgi:hypothetical protein